MFTTQNLQLNRGNSTANAQGKFTTALHTFKDLTNTVAIIRAYLPDYLGQGANQDVVSVGDHMLVIGSDTSIFCQILSLAPFVMSADLFSGASGISIGSPIAAVDNNALSISGETLSAEIADITHSGIVTAVAQTFGGTKTFSAIVAPGTNYTAIAPISAIDANGAVIDNTANTIALENADLTHPGIVTTGAQSFGGVKTFVGIVAPGTAYSTGAPVAATDANAIIIDNVANTIKTEIADATHPGIVTEVAQTFGGVKTFATDIIAGTGIKLPTSGGTPTLLNFYEEYVHHTTFTMSADTTGSVTINITRIGNQVTINITSQATTGAQTVTDVAYNSNTPLPARFRPPSTVNNSWRVINGTTASFGLLQIYSSGGISIFNSVGGTTNYTTSVGNGFDVGSITYTA